MTLGQTSLFQTDPFAGAGQFQARGPLQGRIAMERATRLLEDAGFQDIQPRMRLGTLGVEANLVARDRNGDRWFFEVTGALEGRRPGLRRSDTVRKIISTATLLTSGGFRPFVVLASHLPREETVSDRMLRWLGPQVFFDIVQIGSIDGARRLEKYASQGTTNGPGSGWWSDSELLEADSLAPPFGSANLVMGDPPYLTRLPYEISFLIPSRDRDNQPVDGVTRAVIVQDLQIFLSERNGGTVEISADGRYISPSTGRSDEHITTVTSYGSTEVSWEEIRPLVMRVLVELNQESVAYRNNSGLSRVDREVLRLSDDGEP